MKHKLITSSILAALAISPVTFANTPVLEADEHIVITANRAATNAEDVLASQVVITRADIEEIQAKSVLDILATVSGIDISANGGRGQNASVYMRGANSGHTLVLINGIRIGSATLGTTNLNEIAPELVDRIEIIKGPRAALWGSDAIGGVIQIFTRKVDGGEYFASATFGSDNYQKYSAGFGLEHGDGSTSFSVNHEESDGFDVKDDAESDDDGFDYDSLAINGQQQVNEALALTWLAQVDQGDTEYDSAGHNESAVNNHMWNIAAAYQTTLASYANSTQLSIGQSRTSNISYGNGTAKNEGNVFDTRRDQVSLLNHTMFSANWQVNVGADFYEEQLRGSSEFVETQRDIAGYFAHTVYNQDKFSYELALRYDDVEDVDSETTYNASLGYQISDDTRVVLSTGTSFKAPTFNDLYYPLSWGYVGNKDLSSETSDSVELNITSKFDSLSLSLNVHKTDIENLIAWNGTNSEGHTMPININDVEIEGAELGLNYAAPYGLHQFNISYVNAEDTGAEAGEDKQLIRRAKEFANYKFSTDVANADVYFEWQYKGKRYDDVWGVGKVKLDSYQLINLGTSYPLSSNLKIEAKVNNAFNEQYQTINGYFSQERTIYLGISYQN
ncbi:TonB-dependent receptor domain-containing protein [Thalassotalea sediminis]|uniref:TonB-dependent receptor domain-containing protein n=1 Tax=Thalassotalea sediminis TaxID=1759089 RepID=UPI00257255A7|nr:TonB-dependent receptor [Thalassotalea sediminis]